jgi:hypothetical protein
MTVALVQAAPFDLGEPRQPLELQRLGRPLQLGEVLLDHRVGKIGKDLGLQPVDSRSQFAYECALPNMCSNRTGRV